MNELTFDEIEEVSGALGWGDIIVIMDEAISFAKGFADGFNDAQKKQ